MSNEEAAINKLFAPVQGTSTNNQSPTNNNYGPPLSDPQPTNNTANPPRLGYSGVPPEYAFMNHGMGTGPTRGFNAFSNIPMLTRSNFVSWRELIEIALKISGLSRALTAIEGDLDEMVDMQAKLVLLGTMDESHRVQVRGCQTAKAVMSRLKQIYNDTSASNIYRMLYDYFHYKKDSTNSMSEHIGRMTEMRGALADIGEKQSEALFQVTLIGSCPREYDSILENWEIAHPDMRTTENLISRLLKREADLKGTNNAINPKENIFYMSKSTAEKKTMHCYICSDPNHLRKDCPLLDVIEREKKNKGGQTIRQAVEVERTNIMLMVAQRPAESRFDWIADTGATSHMCHESTLFSELEVLDKPEYCITGNGDKVEIVGRGKIPITTKVGAKRYELTLTNVLYMPEVTNNLFSVGAATKQGIEAIFGDGKCSLLHKESNRIIAVADQGPNKLYKVQLEPTMQVSEVALLMEARRTAAEWHDALGHPCQSRLKALFDDGALGVKMVGDSNAVECSTCPQGKGRRVPHPLAEDRSTTEVGEKVHIDLSGMVNKVSIDNCSYYMLCKDDFSEYCHAYPIATKADVHLTVQKCLNESEVFSGHRVKTIRTDHGSEFVNKKMEFLCAHEGIVHDVTAPYTPQQNGNIEREMETITNIARTVLIASGLDKKLWSEAVRHACYLKNIVPTSRSGASPYERFMGRKPRIANVHRFGREVQVVVSGHYLTKFDMRTTLGYIVGNTRKSNTYRVYLKAEDRIIETSDVIFRQHPRVTAVAEESDRSNNSLAQPTLVIEMGDDVQSAAANETPITSTIRKDRHIPDFSIDTSLIEHRTNEHSSPEPQCNPNNNPESELDNQAPHADETLIRTHPTAIANTVCHFTTARDEPQETTERGSIVPTEGLTTRDELEAIQARITAIEQDTLSNTDELADQSTSEDDDQSRHTLVQMEGPSEEQIPKTYAEAVSSVNSNKWKTAIDEELAAHQANKTWSVVDKPSGIKAVTTKWVFTVKKDSSGVIHRYKARLVARGFEQRPGYDYTETFAPVANIDSFRLLMATSVTLDWEYSQFDVSTAFLNGVLDEEIHIEAPDGVPLGAGQCLKLHKALYGLKQAPRAWNATLHTQLESMGFRALESDPCVYKHKSKLIVVLIYVDDGLVFAPSKLECEQTIDQLAGKFDLKRLKGDHFLGIQIIRTTNSIKLCQKSYILNIIERFGMTDAKSVNHPIINITHLMEEGLKKDGLIKICPYRELVGCIQYLASRTRPDLAFSANFLGRFSDNVKDCHWSAAKRIIRYLLHTVDVGLIYNKTDQLSIIGYSDADWATDLAARQSTTGAIVLVSSGPVSFLSTRQDCISQSSNEAEYVAASETVRSIQSISNFLEELGIPFSTPRIRIDNQGALSWIINGDMSRKNKHIELRYHYVKTKYRAKLFEPEFVRSQDQLADFLTKAVGGTTLAKLCHEANIC